MKPWVIKTYDEVLWFREDLKDLISLVPDFSEEMEVENYLSYVLEIVNNWLEENTKDK